MHFTKNERINKFSERETIVWAAAYAAAYVTSQRGASEAIVVADQAVKYMRAAENREVES
jgi:hypothetical protein